MVAHHLTRGFPDGEIWQLLSTSRRGGLNLRREIKVMGKKNMEDRLALTALMISIVKDVALILIEVTKLLAK